MMIQQSLILFFVGLIIQIWDNNARIWVITLILTIVARLLYIIFTFLPLFLPGFPFQTAITGYSRGISPSEAIQAEVPTRQSAPSAEAVLLDTFIRIVLERWARKAKANGDNKRSTRRSWSSEVQGLTKNYSGYWCKMARVDSYIRGSSNINTNGMADNGHRDHPFLYPSRDGQLLDRWDDFRPFLHTFAFSLRIHILVSTQQGGRTESWEQAKAKIHQVAESRWMPYVWEVVLLAALGDFLNGE
ncbi:hypothetical protein CPB86DRAFT_802864 [Serendipita vermifera]|nr:hypothetical protein CPB86DRAFT_802864 [Serendipita vermifera]